MIRSFNGKKPKIHATAFVHPACEIIGDVTIKAYASIWPGCVLRGDADKIVIGERTNIQDLTVIHCDKGKPVILGKGLVVGHRALIHGSRIADHVLVGMGAIVMNARIGSHCLIGAGAMVLDNMTIPGRSLVLGSPAKIIRPLKPQEMAMIKQGEASYVKRAQMHSQTSYILARI